MNKEFDEKCMSKREITQEPSVTILRDVEIRLTAENHRNNAAYFLEGAVNMLNSNTPLLAVLLGHFAMEHKANELLALKGYKVQSHICTQMGLSRIIGQKELVKSLSSVFTMRQNIGYRMSLQQDEESRKEAKKTIEEIVAPFIKEVDKLIKSMNSQ